MSIKPFEQYDLIIFDCDGTLVDTEHMNCYALSSCLSDVGFPQYTPETVIEKFAAIKVSKIMEMIEKETGKTVPITLPQLFIEKLSGLRHKHQKIIPHVDEFVTYCQSLNKKICVASNGEMGAVIDSLHVANLARHFETDHIFNAVMVPQPKPAPDLFLFACQKMGHTPDRALVFEDSVTGVSAARAAGIDCIGFYGTYHNKTSHSEKLVQAGAKATYDNFIHILSGLQSTKTLSP